MLVGAQRAIGAGWQGIDQFVWRLRGKQAEVDARVHQTALVAFTQLGASQLFTVGVCSYFAALPVSIMLLQAAVFSQVLVLVWEVGLYIAARQGWLQDSRLLKQGLSSELERNCRQWSSLNVLNCIGLAGPNIAIHELGHYVSALLCFKGANPKIIIDPFRGGLTKVRSTKHLTALGTMLGRHNAELLMILGGVIASTAFAMAEFAAAHAYRKEAPRMSELLELHGVTQLANDFLYGVASLEDPAAMYGSDFILAWQKGVHPVLVLFFMVALPLLQRYLLQQKRNTATCGPQSLA